MADPASLIASWLTPSSLFIVVNLVIGTIAITSRFGSTPKTEQPHQLRRSPSLLQRVTSFNLTRAQTQHIQLEPEPEPQDTQPEPEPEPEPQLVRTPSLLERLASFNLSFHKHEPTNAETQTVQHEAEPEPEPKREEVVRNPSVLQRIKSLNLSRVYRSESMHREDPDTGKVEMRKSASESMESELDETVAFDEEVDTKADDFINMFRKQLRLQRMDSLLRYRDMLRGGT